MNRYEDMLRLPHPVSQKRQPMSVHDRAAQFAPFAALTGYDAVLYETGRLTESCPLLAGEAIATLDRSLQAVARCLPKPCPVHLTYFRPDGQKEGGKILSFNTTVKKLDLYTGVLYLEGDGEVPIHLLLALELQEKQEEI